MNEKGLGSLNVQDEGVGGEGGGVGVEGVYLP